MGSPITIRLATSHDVADMIRLELQSPNAAHWGQAEYRRLFVVDARAAARLVLIVERDLSTSQFQKISPVCGFLIARHLAPEWELENIVVSPEMRGKGVGTRLMNELLDRAEQGNSRAVFLEVRESNATARGLYEKLGFYPTGRRKSYYANPLEDAVLYVKKLLPDIT